jgi:hypothetical protein
VIYERVKDYWGKDLNVTVGRDNFDEIRYEYFRDTTVALEAFAATTSTGVPRTARSIGRRATTFPRAMKSACSWKNSRSAARA